MPALKETIHNIILQQQPISVWELIDELDRQKIQHVFSGVSGIEQYVNELINEETIVTDECLNLSITRSPS